MNLDELLPPEFFDSEPRLPKGPPARDDVDAAARLLLEYEAAGALKDKDAAHFFFRCVADPDAVMARAKELSTDPARGEEDLIHG